MGRTEFQQQPEEKLVKEGRSQPGRGLSSRSGGAEDLGAAQRAVERAAVERDVGTGTFRLDVGRHSSASPLPPESPYSKLLSASVQEDMARPEGLSAGSRRWQHSRDSPDIPGGGRQLQLLAVVPAKALTALQLSKSVMVG
eukprot:457047-Hanusia_phi.AAC.1